MINRPRPTPPPLTPVLLAWARYSEHVQTEDLNAPDLARALWHERAAALATETVRQSITDDDAADVKRWALERALSHHESAAFFLRAVAGIEVTR